MKTTISRQWPDSAWTLDEPEHPIWREMDLSQHAISGELKTRMPWGMIESYRALAVRQEKDSVDTVHYASSPYRTRATVFGMRRLSHPRESGYCLEGSVSVDGESHRAFTSSMLVYTEDKHLVDVAILYVCSKKSE